MVTAMLGLLVFPVRNAMKIVDTYEIRPSERPHSECEAGGSHCRRVADSRAPQSDLVSPRSRACRHSRVVSDDLTKGYTQAEQ